MTNQAETETQPTTSNYFEVAVQDDKQAIRQEEEEESINDSNANASTSTTTAALDKADKAEIRRQRIEAAVQRSKGEYKAEHAYTERGWFNSSETERNVLSKPKVDKQHLEYITTSLYYASPPKYAEALSLILRSFDPSLKAKSLGGLTRELFDTALRCALAIGDVENAVKLADSSKSMWKGQFAGIAALASDAYISAGRHIDALTPLLLSISNFGLHEPLLSRLSNILKSIVSSSSSPKGGEGIQHLLGILDKVIIWKSAHLQKPLFPPSVSSDQPQSQNRTTTNANVDMSFTDQPLNPSLILQELNIQEEDVGRYGDLISGLEGTVARLNKGFKSDPAEEVVEKSVREL
ncbi:hypothetical protein I302_103387 [Kwoniella bestiolae CBS 10118]|uniref:Uncharacterized protein n=1 Tax=Kwoniella bestiolae CBS 10118 TaxID=1296100 RepID=A0A1B9G895_9TREE|nr:hypothetical protein I302_02088 [Kwoniella bestiolae CBS 10118]OCF27248.1 hypothetical protein I302_02088 [Kwoniella bestiolae CBS 10118]